MIIKSIYIRNEWKCSFYTGIQIASAEFVMYSIACIFQVIAW